MDLSFLIEGAIIYLCFLPILTVHEFGHAWMAWKFGDDTARLQGRISLNPLVHIDLVGTVILPALMILMNATNFGHGVVLFGWGKPVPVNIYKLHPRALGDILVSVAGPIMNFLLAFVLVGLAKLALVFGWTSVTSALVQLSVMSVFLGVFNLLPVPPLDGSHVLKHIIGLSDETYLRLSSFGFLFILILVNTRIVMGLLSSVTMITLSMMFYVFGLK